MKPWVFKALGWGLLCLGLPGTVYYGIAINISYFPSKHIILSMLAVSGVLTAVGIWILIRAFRKEPRNPRKPYQTTLLDLICVTLFTGLLLVLTQSPWIHWGLIIYTPSFVLGLLITSPRKLPNVVYRLLYGLGTGAWICGLQGVGLMLLMSLHFWIKTDISIFESFSFFFRFFVWGREADDYPISGFPIIILKILVPAAFIFLPVGLALCALIRALSPKTSYKEPA